MTTLGSPRPCATIQQCIPDAGIASLDWPHSRILDPSNSSSTKRSSRSGSPELRGQGLAHRLQLASEEFARSRECRWIDLNVISPRRDELVPFYRKLGYSEQGLKEYPPELAARMLQPGHFILMSKAL